MTISTILQFPSNSATLHSTVGPFLGPSSQSHDFPNLLFSRRIVISDRTLSGAADRAAVTPHGDSLLLLNDVLEESLGALELPAVDRLSGLAGVLERDTEVRPAGAGRLGGRNLSRGVPNLKIARVLVSLLVPYSS